MVDVDPEEGITVIRSIFKNIKDLNIERLDEVSEIKFVSVSIGCSYGTIGSRGGFLGGH